MKTLIKASALAIALSSTMISGMAQAAQKVGVVDVSMVFKNLPQVANIKRKIDAEFKDQINKVRSLEQDIVYYRDKLKRESATMSAAEKKETQELELAKQQEYAQIAQTLEESIRRRQSEERNKLLAVIKKNIDEVAADENYDLILQAGSVAFIKEAHDISSKVIELSSKVAKSNSTAN